jgi:hypothetical protein
MMNDHGTGALLEDTTRLIRRFVALPTDHDLHAIAAWAMHCWVLDAFDSTPRLALLSPEKGSGKSRTLEVLALITPQPIHTVSITAAALKRLVGSGEPVTILIDEADTLLGWKTRTENEDLRGLVNGGHRRGAMSASVSMDKRNAGAVERFSQFAPVALAGIGDLPDTIMDRAIIVTMKRRKADERVDSFRERRVRRETVHLEDALRMWSEDEGLLEALAERLEVLGDDGGMPDGIGDRPADVWEALVAIGDVAGGVWSERIRAACVAMNERRRESEVSLGVVLLRDIRQVFDSAGADRLASGELAIELGRIEGSPWSDMRGKPLDANGLARRLRQFGIRPGSHRLGERTHRSYLRADFEDAWARYGDLPEPSGSRDTRDTRDTGPNVTPVTPVTGTGDTPADMLRRIADDAVAPVV